MNATYERQARLRFAYWQNRLDLSRQGLDSREASFLYLAMRMRDFWAGEVTQLEMQGGQQEAA